MLQQEWPPHKPSASVQRPVVLIFLRHYLPGYQSGGPVRTIANLVEHLGDEFDFQIVTSDRDPLDSQPYSGVKVDAWNRVGPAQVFYTAPGSQNVRAWRRLLRQTPHDALYLNSFFDPKFTFLPLLARSLNGGLSTTAVIAPRGEFSEGALQLKRWKKRSYLAAAKLSGLYRNLIWQASSEHEVEDIRREMGRSASRICVAPNLPAPDRNAEADELTLRQEGAPLRLIFLSRITPKKNLDFALRTLCHVTHPVHFNIYGPVRDEGYWQSCQNLLETLPPHVSVEYRGSLEPPEVPGAMAAHDLFFLPTLGENYGHVIPEALSAGTPALIADTTPWRELEREGVGWVLPLASGEQAFARRINEVAALAPAAVADWRQRVAAYARRRLSDPTAIEANRALFMEAAGRGT